MLLPSLICLLSAALFGLQDGTVANPFTNDRTSSPLEKIDLKKPKKIPHFANLKAAETAAKTSVSKLATDSGMKINSLSSRTTRIVKNKPFSHECQTYFGYKANFSEILAFLQSLETYSEPLTVAHMVLDTKNVTMDKQGKPKQFKGLFVIGSPAMISETPSQQVAFRQNGTISAYSHIKLLNAFGKDFPEDTVLFNFTVKHQTTLILNGHATDIDSVRDYLNQLPYLEKVFQPPTSPERTRKGLFVFRANLRQSAF